MLLVFIALVVANASGLVYHRTIGIPAAQRRLEMERRIMESGDGAVNTRIIGGHRADHLHFPWLAGILVEVKQNSNIISLCSGSLISSSRVVTAAHCWWDDDGMSFSMEVILGSDYIYYGGTRIRTYTVVPHPGSFTRDESTNFNFVDCALVFLPYEVTLTPTIKPIALPRAFKSESFTGFAAFAAGFGRIHTNQVPPQSERYNRYVELEVLPNEQCLVRRRDFTVMCTSGKGIVGICNGDSGGPLSTKICGEDFLIGIIQGTELKDCETGTASHYVRVTKVMDFFALFPEGRIYPHYSNASTATPRPKGK